MFGRNRNNTTMLMSRARSIFWYADIGLSQIYLYRNICSPICANIKTVSEAKKNAWTSDLKWCNDILCPAEGNLLSNNK